MAHDHLQRNGANQFQSNVGLFTDNNNDTLCFQLQDATANLHELNMELTKIRGKHMNIKQRPVDTCYNQDSKDEDVQLSKKQVSDLEKNLYEGMSGVKRQQDSLKKALNRLQNMIVKAKLDRPIQPTAVATAPGHM